VKDYASTYSAEVPGRAVLGGFLGLIVRSAEEEAAAITGMTIPEKCVQLR
jgi:hypothetical protein